MTTIEYLINRGFVTADQIDEARELHQQRGGSLEDQLFLLEAATEADLLKAVEAATGRPTLALTKRTIDRDILACLPFADAWSLRVLPCEEEPSSGRLRIACRQADNPVLHHKLTALLSGRPFELVAAIGPVLDSAIVSQYRNAGLCNVAESNLTHPAREDTRDSSPTAFLITPCPQTDRLLGRLLVADGYRVVMAESPAEVLEDLAESPPELVLLRESDYGPERAQLEMAVHNLPNCTVRTFRSSVDLVAPASEARESATYLAANLHVATAALARRIGQAPEEAVRLGKWVTRLCEHLKLPPHDRLVTVSTAYLQGLAGLCFRDNPPADREVAFYMLLGTADDSLVYPPPVLNVIRRMYANLANMSAERATSKEVRNANLVTVADFYLRHYPHDVPMSPYQYRTIEEHFRSLVGELLLPDVADAFLELLKEEVDISLGMGASGFVLVLDRIGAVMSGLVECVESCGFECAVTDSPDRFIETCRHRHPDALVITADGSADDVRALVDRLLQGGVVLSSMPSILLHRTDDHDSLQKLLRLGLTDIIRFIDSFDILVLRLLHVSSEKERESRQRLSVLQDMGTHGTLGHMNVIDLLQAMGPGQKTLRISVSAQSNQLTMFLSNGQLIHAECDDKTGADAVYEALNWDRGIWSVDHIDPSDLPEPNVHRTIDSLLIEGCHLLDEMKRARMGTEV